MNKLTEKQKAFCKEYIVDLNGAQSAIRAGYSARTAKEQASELLTKPNIKKYIQKLMDKKNNKLIASQDEVLQLLTDIARGNHKETTETIEKVGSMVTRRKEESTVKASDRVKALDLLGRRYGIYIDKLQVTETPMIIDDIGDDE